MRFSMPLSTQSRSVDAGIPSRRASVPRSLTVRCDHLSELMFDTLAQSSDIFPVCLPQRVASARPPMATWSSAPTTTGRKQTPSPSWAGGLVMPER